METVIFTQKEAFWGRAEQAPRCFSNGSNIERWEAWGLIVVIEVGPGLCGLNFSTGTKGEPLGCRHQLTQIWGKREESREGGLKSCRWSSIKDGVRPVSPLPECFQKEGDLVRKINEYWPIFYSLWKAKDFFFFYFRNKGILLTCQNILSTRLWLCPFWFTSWSYE